MWWFVYAYLLLFAQIAEVRPREDAVEIKVVLATGSLEELLPPGSQFGEGNIPDVKVVGYYLSAGDVPAEHRCVQVQTYVTTHHRPIHFEHLRLFGYSNEDFKESINAAIRRILPEVSSLCDQFNAEKLTAEGLTQMRYDVAPSPPIAHSQSENERVEEKGLPLIILVGAVAIGILYVSYKTGQAIYDWSARDSPTVVEQNAEIRKQNEMLREKLDQLSKQGDKVDEFVGREGGLDNQNAAIRSQNDLLRMQNEEMKVQDARVVALLKYLTERVSVLEVKLEKLDAAARAHAIADFERFLLDTANKDLQAIFYAAHNHYWDYFSLLSPEGQQQFTTFSSLRSCHLPQSPSEGLIVDLEICYQAPREGVDLQSLAVVRTKSGAVYYAALDSNLQPHRLSPKAKCHQFGLLYICSE